MKKLVLFCSALLVLCLIPTLTSCKDKNDTNLYPLGMEAVRTMEEMVASDDYAEIMGTSAMSSVLDEVRECDFTRPVAVYSITPPNSDKMLSLVVGSSYNYDLSDTLINQLKNRISFSTVFTYFNAQTHGSSYLAFSSVYQAIIKNNNLMLENPVIYMYIFEDAPSIIVTFSEKTITGQFFFSDGFENLNDIKKGFEEFGCKVQRIVIP